MLLSASLLLLATLHSGVNPSAKLMSPIQNTNSVSIPGHSEKRRVAPPNTLDTPRAFPTLANRKAWEARREQIRQQVLVSCGLYPLPPKTPLKTKIFGRVERDGYTIEKVYFQTYLGFYLAGNLYRPAKGVGYSVSGVGENRPAIQGANDKREANTQHPTPNTQYPGILIAHGHWDAGRMADEPNGSIAARAITFARMGCVAFTYDMVGYNDTRQIPNHRTFGADREHWLWGVSLMGLQTWNSVRALDFLSSLPDVDKSRLAITGESGGGTQTMMLGAIDDRLAAVAPCVMVSHTMQGGCLCENAPGLRVDFSNMEIAASAAPKPQIMVGATGDWTSTMMTVEGPAVQTVYNLEAHPDNLKYVIFPFNHNINKTSRDAVYQFFGKVLLHDPNADHFTEPPYQREPVADLRVFPDNTPLPADAKTDVQLTQYLKELGQQQLEKAKPHDQRNLAAFKRVYRPIWERTLNVEIPTPQQFISREHGARMEHASGYNQSVSYLSRPGSAESIPLMLFTWNSGQRTVKKDVIVLLHPRGRAAFMEADNTPGPLVKALLAQGRNIAIADLFLIGERANPTADTTRRKVADDFGQFFTTYNRTDTQERVQDIITVCACLHQVFDRASGKHTITLAGMEQAGVWTMLAAPAADAVIADCNQLDLTNDAALLTDDLFVPCLRKMGDFRTSLTLAAPHPLLLHNTGAKFTAGDWLRDVYAGIGGAPKLQTSPERLTDDALVNWLATH